MRKAALLTLSVVMAASMMAGCSSKPAQTQAASEQTGAAQAGQRGSAKTKQKRMAARFTNATSSNQAQTGTIGRALEFFCKTVEEKSGGRIKTTANFGNELGSQSEQVEMCQAGALEMVAAAPGPAPEYGCPNCRCLNSRSCLRITGNTAR